MRCCANDALLFFSDAFFDCFGVPQSWGRRGKGWEGAKRRKEKEVNVIERKKKLKRSGGALIYGGESDVTIGSGIWPEAAGLTTAEWTKMAR